MNKITLHKMSASQFSINMNNLKYKVFMSNSFAKKKEKKRKKLSNLVKETTKESLFLSCFFSSFFFLIIYLKILALQQFNHGKNAFNVQLFKIFVIIDKQFKFFVLLVFLYFFAPTILGSYLILIKKCNDVTKKKFKLTNTSRKS